jgi:Flp pilus assembly protein TadB
MMISTFIIPASLFLVACATWQLLKKSATTVTTQRLLTLVENEKRLKGQDQTEVDWKKATDPLKNLSDRLGRAGFITAQERINAKIIQNAFVTSTTILGCVSGVIKGGIVLGLVGGFIGVYLGVTIWVSFLKFKQRDHQRELLFQTPLTLEALILLVESGLGILPAIEKISNTNSKDRNPTSYLLKLVYDLSSQGMPFSQALETVSNACDTPVLRHVLLHLDISGSEGGELIPSLRNLSEHSTVEWRLSVKHRVKRLENFVVFPVFSAVLGLMLLTASVPLIPVLELGDKMKSNQLSSTNATESADFPIEQTESVNQNIE